MNGNILETIVNILRPAVEARKAHDPIEVFSAPPPARSLRSAMPGVIAELKKASPSKGLIRPDFRPVELARELEGAGAAALSVLTEPNFFLGSLDYLKGVAAAVEIPCLRKDFIFDDYQLREARENGASAVLLIAAMLDQPTLVRLAENARSYGLEVLGEAHDADEVKRLLDTPATLIGVNARDLKTFSTDLARVEKLLALVPPERCPVAESAIASSADLRRLREAGACGFLIGETLMRKPHPGEVLKGLLS
jgi:indole-3-glycerol phosphate synthase